MENYVLDALEDLGYPDTLDDAALNAALTDGSASLLYTSVVAWLVDQLKSLCHLNESVSAISDKSESGTFLMELSGFLREFGCPYKALIDGPVNQRISTKESRLQLLDYLLGELAACRIVRVNKPQSLMPVAPTALPEQPAEDDIGTQMKKMMIALKFPKPPPTITAFHMFSKIEAKIKELMSSTSSEHLGKPLLKCRLSDTQWEKLMKVSVVLGQEYENRREMLLKRLDVTIQSFLWSDRAKHKQDSIATVYQPIRGKMSKHSHISIAQILAARDDLIQLQKTSSHEERKRTQCAINKVMIGKVPDRGGRAAELEPPPPEMPGFQQRQAGPPRQQSGRGGYGERGGYSGHGDRGGRGDSRGGRVHGGWSDSKQQDYGGNWSAGGGGYQTQYSTEPGGQRRQGGGYGGQGGGYGGQGGGYGGQGGGYGGQGGGYGGQGGGYGGQGGYQGESYGGHGGYQGGQGGNSAGRGGGYRGRGRGRGGY